MKFLVSPYKSPSAFVKDTEPEISNLFNKKTINNYTSTWISEKKEWERNAMELTMHNLRDTKVAELKLFLTEEGQIVKQLLNLVKIGLNDLVKKGSYKGKALYQLKNTKDFKRISEIALNTLKYSRSRLGVPFEKEEEGIKNAINFNFEMINLEDFDLQDLTKLFSSNGQHNTPKHNTAHTGKVIDITPDTGGKQK